MEELDHLFKLSKAEHVILIDDAREFGGNPAYPTLNEVRNFVERSAKGYEMTVETDIIRITPKVATGIKSNAA